MHAQSLIVVAALYGIFIGEVGCRACRATQVGDPDGALISPAGIFNLRRGSATVSRAVVWIIPRASFHWRIMSAIALQSLEQWSGPPRQKSGKNVVAQCAQQRCWTRRESLISRRVGDGGEDIDDGVDGDGVRRGLFSMHWASRDIFRWKVWVVV
jgi:hypothetical protein